jgi:glutamate/tyrosine decarboxylase-like PLP-dependent enzyme
LIAYVFTLGTTDTGTIEQPSSEALRKLAREDVFIHADAAAGGFTFAHPRVREQLAGLDRVHSVTLDGHKFGHLAYPNAAVVFRNHGWSYEILHEAPYLRNLAPTLEGSRPGSHVAALWAAIQDLGKTGKYNHWLDGIFTFVDRLIDAFESSSRFQILNKVDLTTLAVAPRPQHRNESRQVLNGIVRKMHGLITSDASNEAFLVNVDRGLAGVKVDNSNEFRSGVAADDADSLAEIHCLRIVVTNPAVIPEDAPKLVEYLEHQLLLARNG